MRIALKHVPMMLACRRAVLKQTTFYKVAWLRAALRSTMHAALVPKMKIPMLKMVRAQEAPAETTMVPQVPGAQAAILAAANSMSARMPAMVTKPAGKPVMTKAQTKLSLSGRR